MVSILMEKNALRNTLVCNGFQRIPMQFITDHGDIPRRPDRERCLYRVAGCNLVEPDQLACQQRSLSPGLRSIMRMEDRRFSDPVGRAPGCCNSAQREASPSWDTAVNTMPSRHSQGAPSGKTSSSVVPLSSWILFTSQSVATLTMVCSAAFSLRSMGLGAML